MSFDFALENKLRKESPYLHGVFSDNVLCCQNILVKYKSVFPFYTDHTSLHSLEVIAFCNELVGRNVEKLNCDEIFVLLTAAYLHDSGMGISESDYDEFSRQLPQVVRFKETHPEVPTDEVIRVFHHDFSGKFIEKYQMLFDFPSKEHLRAVIQTARGHRKTDLYDEAEYPRELPLENGNVIRLPYLAALLRITDELDIAEDRNIQFMYSFSSLKTEQSQIEFSKHIAIKQVVCGEESVRIWVDFSNEKIRVPLLETLTKLNATLTECVDVTDRRTPFSIAQKKIEVFDFHTGKAVNIGV